MYHELLRDSSFWTFLYGVDQELAETCRAVGCSCGGRLHRANYRRKPRGPRDLPDKYGLRLSFCCDRWLPEACNTPVPISRTSSAESARSKKLANEKSSAVRHRKARSVHGRGAASRLDAWQTPKSPQHPDTPCDRRSCSRTISRSLAWPIVLGIRASGGWSCGIISTRGPA